MKRKRLRIHIQGAVQGVGFRPFVYRLANELHLVGWTENSPQGLEIEIEGENAPVNEFVERVEKEKPSAAILQSMTSHKCDALGEKTFVIRESQNEGGKTTWVLPDLATCDACLNELFSPSDRRYMYPFINCTHCGPRYSIVEALPYDRPNTTMKHFAMCPACLEEYQNPEDRRFHAQPNACPVCGPAMELWDGKGNLVAKKDKAIEIACQWILEGKIVASKGIGGFHLLVDARNKEAVKNLRVRKQREEKPFAIMVANLESAEKYCAIDAKERETLLSPQSSIVLLKNNSAEISEDVAPGNPYLGVMLPYTPQYHIVMRRLDIPIVATSGNLSDEPICIDELEALQRLKGIADGFLVHNRPIVRHVDDSVVRVIMGQETMLRRGRGYAPLPIFYDQPLPTSLAVGGHLKNAIALSKQNAVFISQHIGDLETNESYQAFEQVIDDFLQLYDAHPQTIVSDFHPNYISTQYAQKSTMVHKQIQHHVAHVMATRLEKQLHEPVLGVVWDGAGYGLDKTIWGGEFFVCDDTRFSRIASLRPFPLLSGDKATKEPKRTALGLVYEMMKDHLFDDQRILSLLNCSQEEISIFQKMLQKQINTPMVSSVGRLFDAVSALLGLRQQVSFEGQAAMELEFLLQDETTNDTYDYSLHEQQKEDSICPQWIWDWETMIKAILEDYEKSFPLPVISAKFHNTLVAWVVDMARRSKHQHVILTGGCFQNRYLLEESIRALRKHGFTPHWPQQIPPNDGGIALGQIAAIQMEDQPSCA